MFHVFFELLFVRASCPLAFHTDFSAEANDDGVGFHACKPAVNVGNGKMRLEGI